MSAAWKIKLSQMGTESLKGLYSRNAFSSDTQSFFSQVLQQEAPLAATALSAAVTSLSVADFGVSSTRKSTDPNTITTVQWQSAFWALVSIALNSCLQQSGNISEIRAKFGLLVKSSPVFCVVDTLVIWGQIIFYLTRVPPRDAIRIVAKSRQQHDPDAEEEATPFPLVVGRCLLSLLAILQALKLYALGGIPWTQAFGTMYLASYLTNALLNVLGKPQTPEQSPQSDMRRGDIRPSKGQVRFLAWIAACFQIAIWTAIVRAALPDSWLTILIRRSCGWPVYAITVLGLTPMIIFPALLFTFLGVAAGIVDIVSAVLPAATVLGSVYVLIVKYSPSLFGTISAAFGCSVKVMLLTFACVIAVPAAVLKTCFLGAFPVFEKLVRSEFLDTIFQPVDAVIENWDRCTPFGLCFLILAVVAIISHILYRALLMGSIARKLGTTDCGMSSNIAWACLFMFAANLSLALLYYGHVYSPEGTWKPSWTENLGRKFAYFKYFL
ncbi:hypothetical protein F5882DRAFT_522720 [Hyaloscypha sp. PMI_1271]|nr:hypothetical protein F5882DRAFT_522720 [Hyaloscypha sp. PMI_1271]